ncbi:succinate dehydrogenase cytochrome b subunit [Lujinxingia litoralis]|nr:succinate dehydrogenase cytochrome b subunit [Lujinxingia litoralis]
MIPLKKALNSSIGRKFVMSISGIALVLFVIVHLLGNLTLYVPDGGEAFNIYASKFAALGPFLYVIELGLLGVIALHITWGVTTTLRNKGARANNYETGVVTKGGPSNLNPASRNMIITGVVLGIFLVVHLWHFRIQKMFTDATMTIDGKAYGDLYGLVATEFQNPLWVAFYVIAMLFLGFHLRHGFWSAFQSLGAMKPQWSKGIYALGLTIAVVLAAGFLGIPVFLYMFGG